MQDLPPEIIVRIVEAIGATGFWNAVENRFELSRALAACDRVGQTCRRLHGMSLYDEGWRAYKAGKWNRDGDCDCNEFEMCDACYRDENRFGD